MNKKNSQLKKIGNIPVANGSSVPAWPAFEKPSSFCACLNAVKEVMPFSLFNMRTDINLSYQKENLSF